MEILRSPGFRGHHYPILARMLTFSYPCWNSLEKKKPWEVASWRRAELAYPIALEATRALYLSIKNIQSRGREDGLWYGGDVLGFTDESADYFAQGVRKTYTEFITGMSKRDKHYLLLTSNDQICSSCVVGSHCKQSDTSDGDEKWIDLFLDRKFALRDKQGRPYMLASTFFELDIGSLPRSL